MLNLDPIVEAVELADLVGRAGVELKRQGKTLAGLCPFHTENTPSFVVFPKTQTWHCFGCGDGGDAIEFVRRWKALDFVEAVKWLADYAHIPLDDLGWTPEAIKEHEQQMQIHQVLSWATNFYQARLWDPDNRLALDALDYTLKRGFTAEHIQAARWGFSVSDNALLTAMLADETSSAMVPLARKVGLIRADGKDYTANAEGDTVSPAGWLVYPHVKGEKVVYLSSRALSEIKKGSKSRNLPGRRQVYRAEWGIDGKTLSNDDLVIVEGPADAESLRRWGWPAWALAGCSLDEQEDAALVAALQKRAERDTVLIGLSNDKAGRAGAMEVARIVSPLARVVFWPKNDGAAKSDANDWLKAGGTPDEVGDLFDKASTYLDLVIAETAAATDVREHAEKLEQLADLVSRLSETERAIYINTIGDNRKLGVSARDFARMVAERLPRPKSSGIEEKAGEFCFWGEPLCNFTARVTHELMKDDGQDITIFFTLAGKLANGQNLPTVEIQADEFDKMRWIGPSWGARPIVYIGGNKLHVLRRAILERSIEAMVRERIHTCTGWYKIDDQRVFLTASGMLSTRGLDEAIRVDLSNNVGHYNLPPPPADKSKLQEAVRASLEFLDLAPLIITAPLWAAVFAAPLMEIKSLNAVMWVYGPTQSKKSVVSHLALSHFGPGFIKGREYKAPSDWTATAADLEGLMFTCKDVPTILDDYAPQFTTAAESRDMVKKAHYVVRSVGNRSSRGRRNADMTARKRLVPRGVVIATAELPLTGQSIVGRLITVPFERESVNLELLTKAQGKHELYSQAMSAYVVWLAEQWDRLSRELPDEISKLQTEVAERFHGQDRLTDYYAILATSSRLALRWMESVGGLDNADYRIVQHDQALYDLLEGQSTRISAESPVLKFFQALDDLLAQRRVELAPKNDAGYVVTYGAALIGWVDREKQQILLITNAALKEVKEYWSGIDERLDILPDALRREMDQGKYLAKRDDRQFEDTIWINNRYGTRRVLIVDATVVKGKHQIDLLQEDLSVQPKGAES